MTTPNENTSSIPPSTESLIRKYTFGRLLPLDNNNNNNNNNSSRNNRRRPDITTMSREDLVDELVELRDAEKLYRELAERELDEKIQMDAICTYLEGHLGIAGQNHSGGGKEAYHQHVGLLHAYYWTKRHDCDAELLSAVHGIQSRVLVERLEGVMDAVHFSSGGCVAGSGGGGGGGGGGAGSGSGSGCKDGMLDKRSDLGSGSGSESGRSAKSDGCPFYRVLYTKEGLLPPPEGYSGWKDVDIDRVGGFTQYLDRRMEEIYHERVAALVKRVRDEERSPVEREADARETHHDERGWR